MWWFRRKQRADAQAEAANDQPRFRFIRGRRVLADDPYVLPKDMSEVNRLDFQHFMLRYALRGNYGAPLQARQVRDIADIGTGTGRWARDAHQIAQHGGPLLGRNGRVEQALMDEIK